MRTRKTTAFFQLPGLEARQRATTVDIQAFSLLVSYNDGSIAREIDLTLENLGGRYASGNVNRRSGAADVAYFFRDFESVVSAYETLRRFEREFGIVVRMHVFAEPSGEEMDLARAVRGGLDGLRGLRALELPPEEHLQLGRKAYENALRLSTRGAAGYARIWLQRALVHAESTEPVDNAQAKELHDLVHDAHELLNDRQWSERSARV